MPGKRKASRRKIGERRPAAKRGAEDLAEREELAKEVDAPDPMEFTDEEEDDGEVVQAEEEEEGEDEAMDEDGQGGAVFRPGIDKVAEGEELEHDPSAYDMFHKLRMEWPCLSFDIVRDGAGASRTKYPLSCYWVCGSQAEDVGANTVSLMKAAKMCKTRPEDDSDDDEGGDDDEDDDEDEDPDEDATLDVKAREHSGCVNRVRVMPQRPTTVATWGEEGYVSVWDFADAFRQLDDTRGWVRDNAAAGGALAGREPPLLFRTGREQGHQTEGFALDWSPLREACLASGDVDGQLWCWEVGPGGAAQVQRTHLTGKRAAPGSVEDICWSATQPTVLISAHGGGSCQVYDTRDPSGAKLTWEAAAGGVDINVVAWNRHRQATHLVATGADDGTLRIWDLRSVQRKEAKPVQSYSFHRQPITSLEWSPINESMVAVACDDDQVTLWDFSIERDAEEEARYPQQHQELAVYPPQLIFQHCGLSSPKEVHWHPQLPGVVLVTDQNGMDVFRPANWKSLVR